LEAKKNDGRVAVKRNSFLKKEFLPNAAVVLLLSDELLFMTIKGIPTATDRRSLDETQNS